MATVRERYSPKPMSANSTYKIPQGISSIGGFLCTVSGTLNVYNDSNINIVVNLAVTAGTYYPLPFLIGMNGNGSVVLSGGAAGTLGI
jgi:hypothetical protein